MNKFFSLKAGKLSSSEIIKKHCLICSYPAKKFTEKSGHIIYKCINCGFGFTDSLNAQKGDYHRDETYIIEERLFENIFLRRFKEITKFIKGGSVLDVGCSTGVMLSIFKRSGFDIKGVEISKKAAQMCQNKGIDVIVGPFEKIKFGEKFDLIILNHTLEHLENPLQALEKAGRILKPKGYIMVDLPNFDSPVAKTLKSHWPHLLPDEHLWHFTPKAFTVLFKKMGYKILLIKKASGIWDFLKPHQELYDSLTGFKKRFIKNFLTALPSLIMTRMNKGSDLLVIARKK